MKNYTLTDLLDIPRLRELLDALDEIHSMPSAILDTEGNILTATAWQDLCTNFHRMNPDTEKKCLESDRHIATRLDEQDAHVIYRCPMGLVDAAIPIIIEGQHLGNVFTGQLFTEPPDETYFLNQARRYGFDENEYLAAMRKIPLITEAKLRKNLSFIHGLTQMLAEQGLQYKRQCEAEEALRVKIDEYATSQQLLRESEARFKALHEASFGGVIIHDKGLILDCNQGLSEITGYSKEELIGMDGFKLIAADSLDLVLRNINSGYEQRYEVKGVRKDGSVYPLAIRGKNIPYQGREVRVIEFRDITGQKQAEEIIAKRLNALTQPMDSGNISFTDLFNIADVQRLQDEFALATGVASLISQPDGTPITAPSNFTRLCDNVIRQSEKGCANCYLSASVLGRYNPDGPTIQTCLSGGLWDAGAAITVGGHHIANWLIGQVRDESQTEAAMRAYARDIGVDEAHFMDAFHEVPTMSREQFERVAKALFTLSRQLSSAAYQNVQQARFITERKRAEVELKAEQFRLSEIIRGTNVGTWEWNIQTGATIFNERWADIIGYTLDELAPVSIETWQKFAHQDDLNNSRARLEKHFNGERDFYEIECRMQHKDGHWVWVLDRGRVSSWTEDGKPLLMFGTHADIDERKRGEEERQTIEKLNTVGTLAGGLAHDFNNILAGVYGNLSMAKVRMTTDHPGFRFLDAAEKSMHRATLLTNQLLTFAKGGAPVKESLQLYSLVEEVVRFNLSGSNIKPLISQGPNLWLAKADQGQIQQVFGNLAINAKQAMPDGGCLHIAMGNADIAKDAVPGLDAGKYILMTVADEGTGIAPEHLQRIFDPYFTTKQTGSGLGLATIYSIINRHGGHISVASQLGTGTTFSLYLPASDEAELPQTAPEVEPASQPQIAKILVMDDEEVIRTTITAMLEELNCTVETAIDGRQAMNLYQQALATADPFDLVILDLTIPGGIGGQQVAKDLRNLDPAVKMIVSSGYADDPVMANWTEYGFKGVISKPYDLNKLLAVLTRALGN